MTLFSKFNEFILNLMFILNILFWLFFSKHNDFIHVI